MNARAKKKIDKRRRSDLHRLLDLYLDINGMQSSCRDRTGNHPTAFLGFAGHVGICTMKIYPSGWEFGGVSREFESRFAPKDMLDGEIPPGEMTDRIEDYLQEVRGNGRKSE